jgi:four helix bundle protein
VGDHRKLEIYRLACELSDRVEDMVEHLPPKVRTRLGDQLVRAAESIHLNIAEGCGFNSEPLLKKHTNYAIASANEVEDALAKLDRRKLLRVEDQDLPEKSTILRKKLGAFLRRLK